MQNDIRKDSSRDFSPERRDVLIGAGAFGVGALAAATAGGMLFADRAVAGEEHQHGNHGHGRKNQAMTDAMNNCVKTGHDCIAHCLDLIKSGDTSIIDCMRSVQETIAFCTGHAYLSAADSKHLNAMCELAIKVCGDCQKECEKHAKKHAQCKTCGDACATCVKECKAHLKT